MLAWRQVDLPSFTCESNVWIWVNCLHYITDLFQVHMCFILTRNPIYLLLYWVLFLHFSVSYVIRASKRRYYQIGAYNFHNYHRLRKTEWDMKAKYLQTLRATDKRWGLWNCRANGTDARSLWDGSIWGCHVWTKTPNICLYPFRFVSIWIFI